MFTYIDVLPYWYFITNNKTKGVFTRREGYPSKRVTLALAHFLFFFLCCISQAARVTQVGGLPYLHVRVSLAGRLLFPLWTLLVG